MVHMMNLKANLTETVTHFSRSYKLLQMYPKTLLSLLYTEKPMSMNSQLFSIPQERYVTY